jgi:hypothetical protein
MLSQCRENRTCQWSGDCRMHETDESFKSRTMSCYEIMICLKGLTGIAAPLQTCKKKGSCHTSVEALLPNLETGHAQPLRELNYVNYLSCQHTASTASTTSRVKVKTQRVVDRVNR